MYLALADVLQAVLMAKAAPHEVLLRSGLRSLSHAEEIEEIMCAAGWQPESLRMTRDGNPVPSEETHYRDGKADMRSIWKLFGDGASIVLHRIESRLPQLSRLCREISAAMNGPSWVNVYISPPNLGAFTRHADDHHVLVQQICGNKTWSVEGGFSESTDSWQLQLAPGDVLYLPRGRFHQAWSSQCVSVHLSIGFRNRSFQEVAISALASQAMFGQTFEQGQYHALEMAIAKEAKRPWEMASSGLLREIDLCSLNDASVIQVAPKSLTVKTTEHYLHVEKDGRVASLPRALEQVLAPLLAGSPICLSSLHAVLDPAATRKIAALLVREDIATLAKGNDDGR